MNKLLFPDLHTTNKLTLSARVAFLTAALMCVLISPTYAEEEETPTPLAGEEFDTEVMGEPVKVAARDRKNVTAASFGVEYLPNGPTYYQVLPFGALYVWRNSDDLPFDIFRPAEWNDHRIQRHPKFPAAG